MPREAQQRDFLVQMMEYVVLRIRTGVQRGEFVSIEYRNAT